MIQVGRILKGPASAAGKIAGNKKTAVALAMSVILATGTLAAVVPTLLNGTPSDNPWDYSLFSFADGAALSSTANSLEVEGDIRSNADIYLSGGGVDITGTVVAAGHVTEALSFGTISRKLETAGQLVPNDVFENIADIAGGEKYSYGKVIYSMQNDSNLGNLTASGGIPFLHDAGGSGISYSITGSDAKTVTVTNRGGTSQGIHIKVDDIADTAKAGHLYKIEYTGRFPDNPGATARIRIENPTGATLATADAVNGYFGVSVVRTAEQIFSDAQSGLRYSLGNTAGNINIVYTGIVITEIQPETVEVYNMQNDSNLGNLTKSGGISFLHDAGSSGISFEVNTNSNPKTVTVTNRGGTSQGIHINVEDINAIAKRNCSYKIEFSGSFPNNPDATARIRIENPTGATLATADAVNGEFTLSVVRTAAQIAADAQSGLRYSLGNTAGSINIVYTGIVITEIPSPDASNVVYDMRDDTGLDGLNNHGVIPFLQGVGASGISYSVSGGSDSRTVTVTNRGGTSQGIHVRAEDINVIARSDCSYMIEYSGSFPNNPDATARIRIENPTGATLAAADAVNGEFTLSVVRTAAQIAADAQSGLRYSLGNTAGNIDIVYTGIVITEIPVAGISGKSVYVNEPIMTGSALNIDVSPDASQDLQNRFGALTLNSYLLSDGDIVINADRLIGGETSKSVIASQNGSITVNIGSMDYNGIIYAPNGKVTINASGDIYGRIFAREIEIVSDLLTVAGGNEDISYIGFTAPEPVPTASGAESATHPPVDETSAGTDIETDAPATETSLVPETTSPTDTETSQPETTVIAETSQPDTVPTEATGQSTTPPQESLPAEYTGVEYVYDRLGRLTKAVFDEENYIQYEYDANGNITNVITVKDGIVQG